MEDKMKLTKVICLLSIIVFVATSCQHTPQEKQTLSNGFEFVGGYPTEATIQKAYDQLDVQRATQAYLNFMPLA